MIKMKKTIMWDLKCPVHDIPLIRTENSIFAWCPKCEKSYIISELRDPFQKSRLLKSIKKKTLENTCKWGKEIDGKIYCKFYDAVCGVIPQESCVEFRRRSHDEL